jgi:hypothetical protein
LLSCLPREGEDRINFLVILVLPMDINPWLLNPFPPPASTGAREPELAFPQSCMSESQYTVCGSCAIGNKEMCVYKKIIPTV